MNTVGLNQANKCMTVAGAAYNLKKLVKHVRNVPGLAQTAAKTIKADILGIFQGIIWPLMQQDNEDKTTPILTSMKD